MNTEKDLQELALIVAVTCVRNTVIEDYHAHGKISDMEMKAFNREVANKLYTFLSIVFFNSQGQQSKELLLKALERFLPLNWDMPTLDVSFLKAIEFGKNSQL